MARRSLQWLRRRLSLSRHFSHQHVRVRPAQLESLESRLMLSVVLDNGLPDGHPSQFVATVGNGGGSTDMRLAGIDTVYAYRAYLDVAGQVFDLSSAGTAATLEGDSAVSVATLSPSGGGTITVEIGSRIPDGSATLVTRYGLIATNGASLSGAKLFQYLDTDVPPSAGDDVLSVAGAIASGDLTLVTIDPVTYVQESQTIGLSLSNAVVSGFAADTYSDLRSRITAGGFDAGVGGLIDTSSLTPGVFAGIGNGYGPADIATAIQYTITSATSAVIRTAVGSSDVALDLPDLRVTRVAADSAVRSNAPLEVGWTVYNDSQTTASGPWTDAVYLSADDTLDASDRLLGTVAREASLAGNAAYQVTRAFDTTGVPAGQYHVIVQTDSGDALSEGRLEANNALATAAVVHTGIVELALGDSTSLTIPAGESRYFAIDVPANVEHLLLTLDDADDMGSNSLYMRYGAPPTLTQYALRGAAIGESDQQLPVSQAAAGTWYVLVTADEGDGTFTLIAQSVGLELLTTTPARVAESGPIVLRLEGLGFDAGTQVRLIDQTGQMFTPSSVDVWSLSEMSLIVDGGLPVGTYDIRLSETDGEVAELADGLVVFGEGAADFRVNLITPSVMGYHALATVIMEYTNEGDAAMRAPLVFVTAEQNDRQVPWLTLDSSLATYGFWTSVKPAGFENYVQILASGEVPGWLLPGETGRVEIYYAGWQQPWDLSYPPFEWQAAAIPADATAEINWNALVDDLQPHGMPDDVWNAVVGNLVTDIGDTWGDYVTMLGENARHLAQLGEGSYVNGRELLALEVFQANAGHYVRSLGGAIDSSIEAPGMPLTFTRLYPQTISSRYRLGALGRGWMHNWKISLSVREDGSVDVVAPDSQRLFQPDSRGGYLSADGVQATLRSLADDAGYTLRESDGRTLHFDVNGRLMTVDDANGNEVTLAYTANRLTAITHSAGPSLTLTYNAGGHVASVVDSFGRTSTFTYDNSGEHLLAVTHDDGTTTSYTYRTTGTAAQRHALASVTLPDGTVSEFAYDSRGRLIEMSQAEQDDGLSFTYGPSSRIVATDPSGQITTIMMDAEGQIGSASDALGRTFSLATDGAIGVTSLVDPSGLESLVEYDQFGNPTRITDPLGNVVQMTIDRTFGGVRSVTDARGNTTRFAYDSAGNLTYIADALGKSEGYTYDSRGVLTQTTNRRGQTVDFTTNALGQVTTRTVEDDASGAATYVYDAFARLVSMTDASGTTTFSYTDSSLINRVTYPSGLYLDFDYDAAGRRTRQTDQSGHQVNYSYDALGQLWRVTDQTGSLIVEYLYDEGGRISRRNLGNGSYATYTYNAAGQIASVHNVGANAQVVSQFQYSYDSHGALERMDTPEGHWNYAYDAIGQLTDAVFVSTQPGVVADQHLTYEYDAAGNRVRTVINGAEHGYEANALNAYTAAGNAAFTYDDDGNLITRTDGTGTWTYTYDALNRLTGVAHDADTWTYTYNGLGQRVASTHNGEVTRYVIDPAGLGNIVGQYDDDGSLIARYDWGLDLASQFGGSTVSYYQFDGIGNTTELLGSDGGVRNVYRYEPFGSTVRASEQVSNDFEFLGGAGVLREGNGLTFMRGRYYDPSTGRFTQQDPIGIGGGSVNLYLYGENNPNAVSDPSGLQSTYHKMLYMALLKKFPHAKAQLMAVMRAVPNTGNFEAFAAMNGVDIAALRQIYLTRFAGAGARFVGATTATTVTTAATSTAATTTTTTAAAGTAAVTAAGTGGFLAWPGAMACAAAASTAILVWQGGSWIASGVGSLTGSDWLSDVGAAMDAALSTEGIGVAYDYYRDWLFGSPSQTVGSFDPNQKLGPAGFGDARHITAGSLVPYRIDFENDAQASAPANIVRITDPLDADLDWTTFELTELGWGDLVIAVPAGLRQFETTRSMTYNDVTFDVHVQAGIDVATGLVSVIFESLDPVTSLPMSVGTGFLPPEDGTGRGQGHVSYLVHAKPSLPTGTDLRNVATIIFDFNEPITTNQIDVHDPGAGTDPAKEAFNTIDATAPTSQVLALSPTVQTPTFDVSWQGSDVGAGVATYDVFVSVDGGNWQPWMVNTPSTSADYVGEVGHSYSFYSVATDGVGLREAAPLQADTVTFVSDVPPFEEIAFGGKTRADYVDVHGQLVSVSLKGAGSGVVRVPLDDSTAPTIILTGTDAGASLTIKSKAPTPIAAMVSNGPLKAVAGKLVDLVGSATFAGAVAALTLRNVEGPGTLTIGGSATSSPVSLTVGHVLDFSFTSAAPVKTIKAASWRDDTGVADAITAPWITSVAIAGDLEADLSLTDLGAATSLSKLTVKGWVSESTIRAASNIGSLTVGGMTASQVLIDMTPNWTGLPTDASAFLGQDRALKSLKIKGIAGSTDSYIDSVIAAWSLGKLSLHEVRVDNNGEDFGVAGQMFGGVDYLADGLKYKFAKDIPTGDFERNVDFVLRRLA